MSAGSLVGRASLLACSALALHTAAHAEIGGMVTLASQERFRGYSVSGGYPAATLSLSYDDVSGPYVEGSVMVAGNVSHGDARTRIEANAGYAFRLKQGPTLDAGIVHAEYSGYRIHGDQAVFTEVYAGMITGLVSAHLHYSPTYFERGVSTLYGDLDTAMSLSSRTRLTAHYGLLLQLGGRHEQADTLVQDWRIGASADIRKLSFELAVASGSRKRSFYGPVKNGGTALLFAVTKAF
jgi:uncharacterized protein (TIGR02001 family)